MTNLPKFTPEQEEEIAQFEELFGDVELVLSAYSYKSQFDVLTVLVADTICAKHRNADDQKEEFKRFSQSVLSSMKRTKEDAEIIDEFERQFNK